MAAAPDLADVEGAADVDGRISVDEQQVRAPAGRDAPTAIEQAPGVLTVNALAETVMMERTAVSRLVSGCVEDGLVRREASQRDGRSVALRLTPKGVRTLRHSRRQQRQAFEFVTRDWPARERLEFARLLHRYAQSSAQLPPGWSRKGVPAAGRSSSRTDRKPRAGGPGLSATTTVALAQGWS